ncbi:MAG: hypothetical protein M3N22_05030 [Acidobacteriota bacterium]|nr:hypothetical protein [Acidobacteriota bacterium]
MTPIRKSPKSKSKLQKPEHSSARPPSKPERPAQKPKDGEAAGPDERGPQVKADEIYGDTKIPQRGGKR